MLYGIITEWESAMFEGVLVSYDSVPDLAWKVWRLAPSEDGVFELVMPSGFTIGVEVQGNRVLLAIRHDVLSFTASRNGACID